LPFGSRGRAVVWPDSKSGCWFTLREWGRSFPTTASALAFAHWARAKQDDKAEIKKVARVERGATSNDGKLVRFELETVKGERLPFELPAKSIGDAISFLFALAVDAARKEPWTH
jgi:hypothetical protein